MTKRTKQTKQTKKYEFTNGTQEFFGRTLHRIVATRNFGDVKAGDLGGFIETEGNLSHNGNAWVCGYAQVSGNARVSGDARVFENAQVSGKARVFENAQVSGNASVSGDAWVFGNARVSGKAWVFGKAVIKDQTHLTQGNHDGEVIKETQADPSEVVTQLRQENEELKAKLRRFLDVADSIAPYAGI